MKRLLLVAVLGLAGCGSSVSSPPTVELTAEVTSAPSQPATMEITVETPLPTLESTPTPTATPIADWLFALPDHNVTSIAFSPDGKLLASAHFDHGITLWDVASRTKVMDLQIDDNLREAYHLVDDTVCCGGEMDDIAFSPDGALVAVARPFLGVGDPHSNARIDVWEVASGKFITALPGGWMLTNLAFSPDGNLLAGAVSSGQSPEPAGKVYLWDTRTWELRRELEDAQPGIFFSPDGTILLTHSGVSLIQWMPDMEPAPLEVWNVDTGEISRTIKADGFILGTALSADGSLLAMSVIDQPFSNSTLQLVDAATGGDLRRFDVPPDQKGQQDSLVFSPDGSLLVSVAQPGHLVIWDVLTGDILAEHDLELEWRQRPVFSPDGNLLAVGTLSGDGQIVVWQMPP